MACFQITKSVLTAITTDVLNLNLDSDSSVFFGLTVTDEVNNKVSSSVVYLAKTGAAPSITPDFVEYAIIGDLLEYALSAVYDSINNRIVLRLQNNHTETLRVDIAEIGKT